jgi:transcriptional regulator with XRE-family HTH domain
MCQLARRLRENAGLNQEELAEKLGCSQSLISQFENSSGHGIIQPTLFRYAEYFGVDVKYFQCEIPVMARMYGTEAATEKGFYPFNEVSHLHSIQEYADGYKNALAEITTNNPVLPKACKEAFLEGYTEQLFGMLKHNFYRMCEG